MDKKIYRKSVLMILIMALATALLQGNPYTSVAAGAPRQPQVLLIFVIAALSLYLFAVSVRNKTMTGEKGILYTVFFGTLMRVTYVLFEDITVLQNDGGTFTGFGTSAINNGHIGYVEYIYKFFHLPDMDPYEYFGYYHPPLHHVIEAVWLTIQRFIGVREDLLFENMQIPTLIYSSLCMIVMLCILEETGVSKKHLFAGMLLFAFHPRMMVLAGSVNNDILALLLLLATIWRTLCWIREKSFKNIILIALSLGFGMISKLNTAICAFSIAVVFAVHFIKKIREGNLVEVKNTILQYLVFGVICIPVGLSYIIRNMVLFGEKPGIPSPAIIPNESVMYTGDYSVWSIIGIPALSDFHAEFPFHPLSAKAIHNTWVILFQTGLFAEIYPAGVGDVLLAAAQIAYVCSILLAIITTAVFLIVFAGMYLRRGAGDGASFSSGAFETCDKSKTGFLWLTYVFMLLSFGLYVFKYPYTCSSDFRYMTASLVFTSLGFVLCKNCLNEQNDISAQGKGKNMLSKTLGFATDLFMILTLVCSGIFYAGWFLG